MGVPSIEIGKGQRRDVKTQKFRDPNGHHNDRPDACAEEEGTKTVSKQHDAAVAAAMSFGRLTIGWCA